MLLCETNQSIICIYIYTYTYTYHVHLYVYVIYLSHVCSHVIHVLYWMYILYLREVKGAKDEPSEVQMWMRTCRILDGGLLAAFF